MRAVSDEQLIEWVARGDASCFKTQFERREDRGGVEVRVESVIVANVNGGPVIKLKALNGDIDIRNAGNWLADNS